MTSVGLLVLALPRREEPPRLLAAPLGGAAVAPRAACDATFARLVAQPHHWPGPPEFDEPARRALLGEKLQCARPPTMSPTCVRHDFLHEEWCRSRRRGEQWPELGRDPAFGRWPEHSMADVVRDLLRNKTIFFAGDSIEVELFDFGRCALWREGLAMQSQYREAFFDFAAVHALGHMKEFLVVPEYRAALQLTDIGHLLPSRRDPGSISSVFAFADIVLASFGLHFSGVPWAQFEAKMVETWTQLNEFGARPGKLALYREVPLQHFQGTGHYDAGAYSRRYGKDAAARASCECEAQEQQYNRGVRNATWWPCDRNKRCPTPRGMNDLFRNLTRRFPHVRLVPFEALTRPRHKTHVGADKGANCDCTHSCWTPEFADAFATGLYGVIEEGLRERVVESLSDARSAA
eukprot:346915-Prymnesium_polylepis.1